MQGKMRVLLLIPGSPEGNSMIFSKRQAADLRVRGVEVHEYYIRSRTSLRVILKELKELRVFIRAWKPDIVHAHYGTVTSLIGALSGGKNLVITFHGSDLNFVKKEFFLKEVFAKIFSQLSVLRAAAVFCVSERLREKLWWRTAIVQVVPIGVDTKKFTVLDKNESRRLLGLAMDKKLVLFNNNAPVKRLDIATEAIQLLSKTEPRAELYVLNGQVNFEQMHLLLNACDCLLLCSDSEGSPVMIKEAMACNLPIVSTDVGDVASVIQNSFPALVSDQHAVALAKAVGEVLDTNLRSNGRDVIDAKGLDTDSLVSAVISTYNELLNTNK